MRSLIKSQEEKHQLNAAMLQSLTDLQRKIDSGRGTARPEGSKSSLGEGEEFLVEHLILKNPAGIPVLLLLVLLLLPSGFVVPRPESIFLCNSVKLCNMTAFN